MSPPCQSFPPSSLPLHVQVGPDHRVRKTSFGGGQQQQQHQPIDLVRDCKLKSLLQYECVVTEPERKNSPVKCWPIERLFRECQDKKGTFMVETTSWEGEPARAVLSAAGVGGGNPNPDGVISHVLEEQRRREEEIRARKL